ncbi:hypothetical protein LCGC14_0410010 [marine sediment metagenome]|uniref:Uncharacterized protein n=1 Tax=marine sediment metagenome TaxID=412755 RepID=A0A0F9TC23_9ZZZZ
MSNHLKQKRKDYKCLPGPTPSRNSAGGYKVTGLGGYYHGQAGRAVRSSAGRLQNPHSYSWPALPLFVRGVKIYRQMQQLAQERCRLPAGTPTTGWGMP